MISISEIDETNVGARRAELYWRMESTVAKEVVLVGCHASWLACSMLYTLQLLGPLIPDCVRNWDNYYWFWASCTHLYIFVLCYMCGLIYELKDTESESNLSVSDGASAATPTPSPSTVMKMASTSFRGLLSSSCLLPLSSSSSDQGRRAFCLLLVVLQGQALISGMRFSKSCYVLLLALLAGVVTTSYDGLGNGNDDHPDDPLLYKLVCFLSLFLVFLCGVYLCHRASETSQPPLIYLKPPLLA